MGAIFGRIRETATPSEHNSRLQLYRPERANNKRVEEERRARVAWLEGLRSECASEEEFHTARSQPLLTQLDSTSCSSSTCARDCLLPAESECIRQENRCHFQRLIDRELSDKNARAIIGEPISEELTQSDFSMFYVDCEDRLEAGKKIGGGGQAEIHEAIYDGKVLDWCVLKVFGSGYLLADLQRTWISDIGRMRGYFRDLLPGGFNSTTYVSIKRGTLLQDGRFAFVLQRCWGDLRKVIDLHIIRDVSHQSPPFPNETSVALMAHIAHGMETLHVNGIIHRDLKAANCLLVYDEDQRSPRLDFCVVADYESCEGVEGTRFWRAPEVLLAQKKREGENKSTQEVWTKKADVYSYAMTCYEILTGCIPFENCAATVHDGVIGGERPSFPDYVDPKLQELVQRCWHCEPLTRPSFYEILREIKKTYPVETVTLNSSFIYI